jgi:hypothetical protein
MEVKGSAFVARKALIEKEHGAARFEELLEKVRLTEPAFRQPILATTRIPLDAFLRFNDRVVAELYDGDDQSYFRFGEASAIWALTSGPYKHLVTNKSVAEFAASAPNIYRTYFTEGEAKAEVTGDRITLRLFGIEARYRHVYVEYAIMGYFKKGLELVSARKVKMTAERGFARGDAEILYHFNLG